MRKKISCSRKRNGINKKNAFTSATPQVNETHAAYWRPRLSEYALESVFKSAIYIGGTTQIPPQELLAIWKMVLKNTRAHWTMFWTNRIRPQTRVKNSHLRLCTRTFRLLFMYMLRNFLLYLLH